MTDDLIARLREAFDGDNVPAKNFALRKAFDALEAKDKRIEKLSEAIGLLTTLNPNMEIDADNPVRMAIQIVAHVDARIAELERENEELKKDLRKWRVVLNHDGSAIEEKQ